MKQSILSLVFEACASLAALAQTASAPAVVPLQQNVWTLEEGKPWFVEYRHGGIYSAQFFFVTGYTTNIVIDGVASNYFAITNAVKIKDFAISDLTITTNAAGVDYTLKVWMPDPLGRKDQVRISGKVIDSELSRESGYSEVANAKSKPQPMKWLRLLF